jgi:hypothetical protein
VSPDRVAELLRDAPVPASAPARERAVATARAEIAARGTATHPPRTSRRRRRALTIVCAAGLLAAALLTPPGRAASGWIGERLGIGEPGGPPTIKDRATQEKIEKSIVFAAGRAPDGGRYEVVLDRFARPSKHAPPGETFNNCLDIEWPDVRREGRSGFCGPVFPPAASSEAPIGRYIGGPRTLERATKYLELDGFTRSDVARVEVRFRDKAGATRDAPVNFIRVRGKLRTRLGADRPFGFYVAFLPPSFPRYTGALPRNHDLPPCPDAYERRALELIAYDDQSRELKRVTRDNATAGRVRC